MEKFLLWCLSLEKYLKQGYLKAKIYLKMLTALNGFSLFQFKKVW